MAVEVFSHEKCSPCEKAKKYLEKKDVEYEERDITKRENFERVKNMKDGSGNVLAVPVICIDGECLVGFDKDKIDSNLRGYYG